MHALTFRPFGLILSKLNDQHQYKEPVMRKFSGFVVVLFLCFGIAAQTQAQSSSSSGMPRIFVTVYQPKGAPVFVSTWTLTPTDLLGEVTIQNPSAKTVTSMQFTWIAGTPDTCSIGGVAPQPESGVVNTPAFVLNSHHSMGVTHTGLGMEKMLLLAASQGRLLIDLQVIPTKITFDDGTEWNHSSLKPYALYDPTKVKADGVNCANQKLIPSNKLLAAQGQTPHRSPNYLPGSSLAGKNLIGGNGDAACDLDGDCGGASVDGRLGSQPLQANPEDVAANSPCPTPVPPTQPPGSGN
jgi:hypothetical protein